MEKTITIDGKEVRLKSTAATAMFYKAQFKRDMFADIYALEAIIPIINGKHNGDTDFSKIDFDVIYNLTWTFAKMANMNDTPAPFEFFNSFGSFDIQEVALEITDLINNTISGTKKKN